jgi:membrane complex biogenesis BtpA family protein
MDQRGLVPALFGVPRALIGMIHAGALPGAPLSSDPVDALCDRAVAEARLLQAAGFHALLLENMHDRPYVRGAAPAETVAAMTAIAREVRRAVPLPLGLQVLAGANAEALAVAHAAGACFVRVEGFVFAHVGDEGLHQSDAGALLRYRRAIGAGTVRVFADVKKKHSAHALTADVSLVETARAAEFFLADGVIVTGSATGEPADAREVAEVAAATALPTLVGSGVDAHNVASYRAADALIVGSALKVGGHWTGALDEARCAAVARAFRNA